MEYKEIIIPNVKPKFKVGQVVFRIIYGDLIEKNTIRKVDYMNRREGVCVVYYFYRERTPYNEEQVFATGVEAQLALMKMKIKTFQSVMGDAMERLKKAGLTEQEVLNRLQCKELKLLTDDT